MSKRETGTVTKSSKWVDISTIVFVVYFVPVFDRKNVRAPDQRTRRDSRKTHVCRKRSAKTTSKISDYGIVIVTITLLWKVPRRGVRKTGIDQFDCESAAVDVTRSGAPTNVPSVSTNAPSAPTNAPSAKIVGLFCLLFCLVCSFRACVYRILSGPHVKSSTPYTHLVEKITPPLTKPQLKVTDKELDISFDTSDMLA